MINIAVKFKNEIKMLFQGILFYLLALDLNNLVTYFLS